MDDKQYISNQEIVIPDIVIQILATKMLDYQKLTNRNNNNKFSKVTHKLKEAEG